MVIHQILYYTIIMLLIVIIALRDLHLLKSSFHGNISKDSSYTWCTNPTLGSDKCLVISSRASGGAKDENANLTR